MGEWNSSQPERFEEQGSQKLAQEEVQGSWEFGQIVRGLVLCVLNRCDPNDELNRDEKVRLYYRTVNQVVEEGVRDLRHICKRVHELLDPIFGLGPISDEQVRKELRNCRFIP